MLKSDRLSHKWWRDWQWCFIFPIVMTIYPIHGICLISFNKIFWRRFIVYIFGIIFNIVFVIFSIIIVDFIISIISIWDWFRCWVRSRNLVLFRIIIVIFIIVIIIVCIIFLILIVVWHVLTEIIAMGFITWVLLTMLMIFSRMSVFIMWMRLLMRMWSWVIMRIIIIMMLLIRMWVFILIRWRCMTFASMNLVLNIALRAMVVVMTTALWSKSNPNNSKNSQCD